jgi:AmmeMemoRadiSam system protein B/AmmeMemoRadiSam system protein A
MKTICVLLAAFLFLCLLSLISLEETRAENLRKPVWAGKFYPGSRSELVRMIDRLTQQAEQTRVQPPAKKSLRALILPHAGYIYSGFTAAHASHVLKEKQFAKVVLLAPDHRVGFRNGAISDVGAYETPLGPIKLHGDAAKLREGSELFQSIPASDRTEHSLEVILPFLQHYLKSFDLVPVVLGPGNVERLAAAIDSIRDPRTLLVISSDLSHFLPYHEAVSTDRETINMILNLESADIKKKRDCACGKMPILILLDMARKHKWRPLLLHYSNSGDTAGDRSRVVGYTAIAFYEDSSPPDASGSIRSLSPEQAQILIKLARKTIMEELGLKMKRADTEAISAASGQSVFQKRSGTFVTLTIDGRLRGCIGNLAPTASIWEGVRRNAANAAFNDPRFPALNAEELERVDIEISILTLPKTLEYKDSSDLLSKLRTDIDGVIIQKGAAGATYLPQVWKQLPRKEEFLTHLCRKARLPGNAWKTERLNVLTYQVHYYDEEK